MDLPLAENQFGRDMFVKMAIRAPLTALALFAPMLWSSHSFALVGAAMAIAILTAVSTVRLLIGSGFSAPSRRR